MDKEKAKEFIFFVLMKVKTKYTYPKTYKN